MKQPTETKDITEFKKPQNELVKIQEEPKSLVVQQQ